MTDLGAADGVGLELFASTLPADARHWKRPWSAWAASESARRQSDPQPLGTSSMAFFRRTSLGPLTVAMSLAYGAFFGNVVLLPLWLQQYMGYTATWAGLILAPVGLLAILLMPVVGKYMNRVDPRIFGTAAFASA